MKALFAIAALFMTASNAPAPAADVAVALGSVREQIILHAPYKQWNMITGAPNREIGRTPGAACEAVSYLVRDSRATGSTRARAKAVDLAKWVMTLQAAGRDLPVPGGVPATPDLAAPSDAYYYSIDAAFCGLAMLDMADLTNDRRYEQSAGSFGTFLLAMMRNEVGTTLAAGRPGRAPCEAVVQKRGAPAAWDCRRFVKSLAALPLFARLNGLQPAAGYAVAARDTRATLLPGLRGLWEYADGPSAAPKWHRIQGPHGEPDMFVFGDTMSYAFRALHEYEGATGDLRAIYADVGRPRSHDARTATYDPGMAYAGYIMADSRAADPRSHYYDVVTLGHLRDVRRDIAPSDMRRADDLLLRRIAPESRIGWKMDMDRTIARTGMGDISTLSSIGSALVGIGAGDRKATGAI